MQSISPGARLASTFVLLIIASLVSACSSGGDSGDVGAGATGTGVTSTVTEATTTETTGVPDATTTETDTTSETTTPDSDSATIATSVVTWVAPAAREDNSPFSMAEIAAYRIYYGDTQGDYQNQYEITDAYDNDLDPAELGLPAGVYYVVITTVDSDGRESTYSEEVTLNI